MSDTIVSETDMIQTYLAPLAKGVPGAFGLTDDCAALPIEAGMDFIVTTDPIIAGVHFFPDDRAEDIAWKALAVNVSDLIAKGAEPFAYTMALALPAAAQRSWISAFARGLEDGQAAFGCHLVGGDSDRTPGPLSISITAFGKIPHGAMVRRSTAREGDHLFVTGTIGDSAIGLNIRRDPGRFADGLSAEDRDYLIGRYLRPSPRLLIRPLVRAFASAALDVSDGLVKDLRRLAEAAGAAASIPCDRVPLSPPAQRALALDLATWRSIVAGGDDFEVLFAVSPHRLAAFREALRGAAVQVTEIGVLERGLGVTVLDERGARIDPGLGGYDHFG